MMDAKLEVFKAGNGTDEILMQGVRKLYADRSIDKYKTAETTIKPLVPDTRDHIWVEKNIHKYKTGGAALKALTQNKREKFGKKFGKKFAKIVVHAKEANVITRRDANAAKIDLKIDDTVKIIHHNINKPKVKTKNWETEAPSVEIQFVSRYTHFSEAWSAGKPHLIKKVKRHMTQKQPNIKLYIGIKHKVKKQAVIHEDQDPDPEHIRVKQDETTKILLAMTE